MQALFDVETTWLSKAMREGLEKGLQEGRQEGMHTLLLLMFNTKFGELPQSFVTRLNSITDQGMLADISRQLLTAHSLDEISLPNPRNN